MTSSTWDPSLYDDNHSFVWENGTDLVDLLAPRPGERILDVGCGTGHLTARIAQAGAKVVGIDNSASMIDRARQNYPDLRFEQGDVRNLTYGQEFEAVFSNAVLHWVRPPEAAVEGIRQALKPGGRFVAELGGEGNIALILDAVDSARKELGVPGLTTTRSTFFFPSPDEYTSILESHGFSVTQADMFDRPTPLDGGAKGMRLWLDMFAGGLLDGLEGDRRSEVISLVEAELKPLLYGDRRWTADYKRLRVVARRLPL